MNQDTEDFLATLLWADLGDSGDCPEMAGRTVYDFSDPFISAVESFVSGFREYVESTGFDMSRLEPPERSFGGNVYLSLSGHGAGFFDSGDRGVAELQRVLETWAGECRFEGLGSCLCIDDNNKIDFSFLSDYIEGFRDKYFAHTHIEIHAEPAGKQQEEDDMGTQTDEAAIEQEIKDRGLTAPRLMPGDIDDKIRSATFTNLPSGKCVVCEITLQNGFTVRGESACVSPENFDQQIGNKIAHRNARDKIWELEGYLLQERYPA